MIKKAIELAVRNPLLVIAACLILAGAGWQARRTTPVDAIPDIGENQVIVFVDWMGRSPKDIEDQIIYPLSTKLLGIPGIKDIRSNSMFSFGYVNIIFKHNVDLYWARTRVLERLDLARKDLPEGVLPYLGPDATGLGQIFWYTVENGYYCSNHPKKRYASPGKCPEDGAELVHSTLDLYQLRTLQDWYIRYYLQASDGVTEVAPVGGYVYQYQIDVDPNKLVALGVSLEHVFMAVRDSNLDVGAKVIEEGGMEVLLRGIGFVKKVEDIENIVVESHSGVPIYVRDVAEVTVGPDFREGALDKDGLPAVGGIVLMRYGGDPLRVIAGVKEKIRDIEAGLPAGVRIVPFYDRTSLIERAQATLDETLILEILLTSSVALLFLGLLVPSFVVALILPFGVLASYLGMKLIGIPANIMSLSGIAIAIGEIADAGISLTENVTRLLAEPHEGKTKRDVVLEATKEVGPPIFYSFLIIMVAFIPVFVLKGQAGKMFTPLAYTKTFAMLGATIVTVTLVPILCAIFFSDPTRRRRQRRLPKWARVISFRTVGSLITGATKALYRPVIRFVMKSAATKVAVLVVAGLILLATFPLTPFQRKVGQEFMPPLNERDLLFMPVLLPSASLTTVKDVLAKQNLIMSKFPEVKSATGKLGRAESATDPAPVSMIETIISIEDPKDWPSRRVKTDRSAAFVETAAERLKKKGFVGFPPIAAADAEEIAHNVAARMDELTVSFHQRKLDTEERERIYRQWFVRLVFDEILKRGKGADASGLAGEKERELHQLASEMADALSHSRYFRRKTRDELVTDLIEATRMPGVSPIMTQPIRNRIDMLATGIQTPVGIKVYGKEQEKIEEIAIEIEKLLAQVPGARNPYAERIGNKPYLEFQIDREAAARYGIRVGDVQMAITTAIGGMNITTTVEGRERYPVRVRYMRELRDNVEALKRILIAAPKGEQIPLAQVVKMERRPGPAMINSENTILYSRVFCDVDVEKVGLVDFVNSVEKTLSQKLKPRLPHGYFYAISGQYEAEIEARKRLIVVVPLCLFVISLLLYVKFRSVAAILSVLSALPFAFVGGVWLQWLMQYVPPALGGGSVIKYSTSVWVGYIALFGVAVQDSIVLISFAMELCKGGGRIDDNIVKAGLLRVRPIVMTTATTILALLPIMLYEVSTTTGAELMKPLAIPSFGGMITCTITNLILAPVLFSFMYPVEIRIKNWMARRRERILRQGEPAA
ncbi:MAG: efflux RND transporter permease subunit [bacterium]|nr:efflux RND transporter permease subunit [bacterium]